MSKEGGLNIVMDDSLVNPIGSVTEVSTEESGEVIDPKQMKEETEEKQSEKKEEILEVDFIDDTKSKKTEEDEKEVEDESKLDEEETSKLETDTSKKEEDESGSDDDDDAGIYKDVTKHFYDEGIISDFDEKMDNSPEGFRKAIEDTVAKRIEEYKDKFQNDTAKKFLEYLENGGDPSRFIEATSGIDYSQISDEQIEDSIDAQKQVLRNQLSAQGEDQEDIEDIIQSYEDSGKLEKMSLKALQKLQRSQEKEKEQLIEEQKKQAERQKEANQQMISDLKTKIDGLDDIGGFPITKKEKGDFFDYITKVDPKTGKTGLMTDSSDAEKQMLMSYMYWKNFDFGKLEKKAKTKAARGLEETLGRYTDGSSKQKSRQRTKVDKKDPSKLNLGPMRKLFG